VLLVDDATGNEVSGLLITNIDTAEAHLSVCGGVDFAHLGVGNNDYTSAAGAGSDCVTTLAATVEAGAAALPAGGGTIHVDEPPIGGFLIDTFAMAVDEDLDGHVPDVGDPWDVPGAPGDHWQADGTGGVACTAGASTFRTARNLTVPPSADYQMTLTMFQPGATQGFQLMGAFIRWTSDADNLGWYFTPSTGEFHVFERNAGVQSDLDLHADAQGTLTIAVVGDQLTLTCPDTTVLGPFAITPAAAGNICMFCFGDITHAPPSPPDGSWFSDLHAEAI
jgi:hypothetical protein